jgi:hypothetical protein
MKDGNRSTEPKVREALERSTEGLTADVGPLVDAVPGILREARRRRSARVDTLTASIPFARTAIPRLAAAAAVLVAITAVLWVGGNEWTTAPTTTADASQTSSTDDWLLTGDGVTEEQILRSLIGGGETP